MIMLIHSEYTANTCSIAALKGGSANDVTFRSIRVDQPEPPYLFKEKI